ncbi:MAG: hypothetical protein ACI4BD_03015 [Paludibacteraceae bacterium]
MVYSKQKSIIREPEFDIGNLYGSAAGKTGRAWDGGGEVNLNNSTFWGQSPSPSLP